MLRNDIVKIVNAISEDYATKSRNINGVSSLEFNLMECYNTIFNYCKENKTRPNTNSYRQENGLLFINDKPVHRIGLMYNKPRYNVFNENSIDYELKILAMQESNYI